MLFCALEIRSVTASFRNPEFQNFHKSFRLPPPTTLIGLAGAAMGLSPKAAQDFFDENPFRVGIAGKSKGMMRDLWKYDTMPGRSVITRELFANSQYWIAFGSPDHALVHRLKSAFESPVYALTMGTSDSLAKVIAPRLIEQEIEHNEIEDALVENDIVPLVLAQAMKGGEFSFGVNDADPVAYQLPVRFGYESDYGLRRVTERKLFSFVGPKVKFVDETFTGIMVDSVFIPTFDL